MQHSVSPLFCLQGCSRAQLRRYAGVVLLSAYANRLWCGETQRALRTWQTRIVVRPACRRLNEATWRRERDSNPRGSSPGCFQDSCLQPLGHPSTRNGPRRFTRAGGGRSIIGTLLRFRGLVSWAAVRRTTRIPMRVPKAGDGAARLHRSRGSVQIRARRCQAISVTPPINGTRTGGILMVPSSRW
jgi:hypothetical protein